MTGTGHLGADDAEALWRVLEDARRDDDAGPVLPWALLDGLARLLTPGTWVSYQLLDLVDRRVVAVQETSPDGVHEAVEDGTTGVPREEEELWFELSWCDPLCSYPHRTGDLRTVVLSTDFFPTRAAFRARPLRQLIDPEITSLMEITLPSAPGTARRVVFATCGGPDLGERDRQIGALLRPHLEEARLDAERRRAGVPRLTPREWEVLALTAAGLSHAQIAERLYVSVSTVHKHMENVRRRLGVSTAAAAAAVALPHALGALVTARPDPSRSRARGEPVSAR